MLIARHHENGKIWFEEYHPKPLDPRRLQSAMFTDRADLWRKPAKRLKPIPPQQLTMLQVRP
jgi:hypothetical protein